LVLLNRCQFQPHHTTVFYLRHLMSVSHLKRRLWSDGPPCRPHMGGYFMRCPFVGGPEVQAASDPHQELSRGTATMRAIATTQTSCETDRNHPNGSSGEASHVSRSCLWFVGFGATPGELALSPIDSRHRAGGIALGPGVDRRGPRPTSVVVMTPR